MPAMTGDVLLDTYNTLLAQRLELLQSGPQVSYNVHGHQFSKTQYMEYLDRSIRNVQRAMAQVSPVEEVGLVG